MEIPVHHTPSDVEPCRNVVRIEGPADVLVAMTPGAALETARRMTDAAVDALMHTAGAPGEPIPDSIGHPEAVEDDHPADPSQA